MEGFIILLYNFAYPKEYVDYTISDMIMNCKYLYIQS